MCICLQTELEGNCPAHVVEVLSSVQIQQIPLSHFLTTSDVPLSPTSASVWLHQNSRMHIWRRLARGKNYWLLPPE